MFSFGVNGSLLNLLFFFLANRWQVERNLGEHRIATSAAKAKRYWRSHGSPLVPGLQCIRCCRTPLRRLARGTIIRSTACNGCIISSNRCTTWSALNGCIGCYGIVCWVRCTTWDTFTRTCYANRAVIGVCDIHIRPDCTATIYNFPWFARLTQYDVLVELNIPCNQYFECWAKASWLHSLVLTSCYNGYKIRNKNRFQYCTLLSGYMGSNWNVRYIHIWLHASSGFIPRNCGSRKWTATHGHISRILAASTNCCWSLPNFT